MVHRHESIVGIVRRSVLFYIFRFLFNADDMLKDCCLYNGIVANDVFERCWEVFFAVTIIFTGLGGNRFREKLLYRLVESCDDDCLGDYIDP